MEQVTPVIVAPARQTVQAPSSAAVVVTAKRPKDVSDPRGLAQFSLNQADISFLSPLNTSDLLELVAVQAGVDRNRGFDGIVVNGIASRDTSQLSRYPLGSILSVTVSSGEIASAAGFLPSELLLVVNIKPNYSQVTANLTTKGEESLGGQTIAEINHTVFKVGPRDNIRVPSNRASFNLKLTDGADPLSNPGFGVGADSAIDAFRYDANASFEQTKLIRPTAIGSVLTARLNLSGSETARQADARDLQGVNALAFRDVSKTDRAGFELGAKFPLTFSNVEGRFAVDFVNTEQENMSPVTGIARASQSETVRTRWSLGGGRVISYNPRIYGKSFYLGTSLDWTQDHRSNLFRSGLVQTQSRQLDRSQQSSIFMFLNINNIFRKSSSIPMTRPSPGAILSSEAATFAFAEARRLLRFGSFNLNLRLTHRSQSRFDEAISSTASLNWRQFDWGMSANLTHTTSLEATSLDLLTDIETRQIGTVFDYAVGQPVNATLISGRPVSKSTPQSQTDIFRLTWQPKFAERLNLNFTLNRRISNNGLIGFPALTADVERLLPGRIVRGATGALVSVDLRPVPLAGTRQASMIFGFSTSVPFGASQSLGERLDEVGSPDLRMQGQLVSKNRLNFSMGYRTQLYDEVALSAGAPFIDRVSLAANAADRWRSNLDTLAIMTMGAYSLRLNSNLSFDNQSTRRDSQDSQHSWSTRATLNLDQMPKWVQRYPNLDDVLVYFEVATRPVSAWRTDIGFLSTIDRYSEQSLADARGERSTSIYTLGVRKSF